MRKIIIDIDNTLWDFATELEKRLQAVNPAMPSQHKWLWSTPKKYVQAHEFYKIVNDIHLEQEKFMPYNDACQFLKKLAQDFHIIIASHRTDEALNPTFKWLIRNDLYFDVLHCCRDKTMLFDRCVAVVDDCPEILEKALNKGLVATGLYKPWNKYYLKAELFNNLEEIYRYIVRSLLQSVHCL